MNLSLVKGHGTKRISSTVDLPHACRTNERACQERLERKHPTMQLPNLSRLLTCYLTTDKQAFTYSENEIPL